MQSKLKNHPGIIHGEAIKQICQPLKALGIDYFSHTRTEHGRYMSGVSSDPVFTEFYFQKQYFNTDIHLAGKGVIGDTVIWDLLDLKGNSLSMHKRASEFGINHTFSIIRQHGDYKDCYQFATSHVNASINAEYLSKREQLELFILHFTDRINHHRSLKKIYDVKFRINSRVAKYDAGLCRSQNLSDDIVDVGSCKKFMTPSQQVLTTRELQVLMWLRLGKTGREIACILGISESTIRKHIDASKRKFKCENMLQLGCALAEFFGEALPQVTTSLI